MNCVGHEHNWNGTTLKAAWNISVSVILYIILHYTTNMVTLKSSACG